MENTNDFKPLIEAIEHAMAMGCDVTFTRNIVPGFPMIQLSKGDVKSEHVLDEDWNENSLYINGLIKRIQQLNTEN